MYAGQYGIENEPIIDTPNNMGVAALHLSDNNTKRKKPDWQ